MRGYALRWILVPVAVVWLSVAVMAAERYVSPSGDDGGDGSAGSPWQTVNHAVTQLAAGDRLNLEAGATPNTQQPSERRWRIDGRRTPHSPCARTWKLEIPCWIVGY